MKVLFMGTPGIAAQLLQSMVSYCEVCGVFCQPDKPVGRKGILTPPAAKTAAAALGIPVYQPQKLGDGQAMQIIGQLAPDLIVVVAYGKILPKAILDYPKYGCINVHVSLLPKYRGAAPIQYAILNGETETGVTVMYMDEGLDTGDMIAAQPFPIAGNDDANSVFERAAQYGIPLLKDVICGIARGVVKRTPQNEAEATFAPQLTKDVGRFEWSDGAHSILHKIRAFVQWPVAYFEYESKKIKVHKAAFSDLNGQPGEVLLLDPLTIAAKDGAVQLLEVTPQGSRLMTGKEFAAGKRLKGKDIIDK